MFYSEILSRTCVKHIFVHEKNCFAKIFKNLARYRFENNFVCYVGHSN